MHPRNAVASQDSECVDKLGFGVRWQVKTQYEVASQSECSGKFEFGLLWQVRNPSAVACQDSECGGKSIYVYIYI